jgi:hypothetical protein
VRLLGNLTYAELRKLADARGTRWFIGAIITTVLALTTLPVAFSRGEERVSAAALVEMSQLPLTLGLPILAMIVAASDWHAGIIGWSFVVVPQRSRILAAKILATVCIAAIAAVIVLTWAVCVAAVAAAATGRSADYSISTDSLSSFGALAATTLSAFSIASLTLSVIVSIVVLLTGEAIVSLALSQVAPSVVPWATMSFPELGMASPSDWAQFACGALLWVGLPLLAAFIRQTRMEVRWGS